MCFRCFKSSRQAGAGEGGAGKGGAGKAGGGNAGTRKVSKGGGEERERGAARVDRDGVADTMVREADRIMREMDGFAREVDVEGSRGWQLVY